MRYTADHKEKTKEALLALTADALREDGPERLGVAAIMAKAGLTHGGFYAHFPSKDALIAETIDRFATLTSRRLDWATEGRSAAEGLARYIDFYVSTGHRDARAKGCPLPALSGDVARMEPLSRASFGDAIAQLTARLAGLLEAVGQTEPGAAYGFMAEAVGAVALARAVGDEAQSDAILSAARTSLRRRAGLDG